LAINVLNPYLLVPDFYTIPVLVHIGLFINALKDTRFASEMGQEIEHFDIAVIDIGLSVLVF